VFTGTAGVSPASSSGFTHLHQIPLNSQALWHSTVQAGCLRSQPVHDRIANAALWHSTRAGGTPAVPVKRALLKSNGHRPLTTDY